MQRRSFSWVALAGIGVAGVVAVSAATALAAARGEPVELVLQGRYEAFVQGDVLSTGRTRRDVHVRCAVLRVWDHRRCNELPREVVAGGGARRYTCADGSGSLTLAVSGPDGARATTPGGGQWTMASRDPAAIWACVGRGPPSESCSSGDPWDFASPIEVRTTLQGLVAADAVAPSLAFTSASVTKLRRPAGAYSIKVALSLRDDVEGSTVAYMLRVKDAETRLHRRLIDLASKEGKTASGSVSTALRVVPGSKRARSVQLLLSGSDPVGNEVSLTRSLKLPRSAGAAVGTIK